MNINLIGMRGVGKSNVARRMSVLSKRQVMSTDALIEYEHGMSIPDFVALHGGDWRAFRDAEATVLAKLSAMDGLIVDCGGGIVVDLNDRGEEVFSTRKVELLSATGPIVWLEGDIARLAAKLADDPSRPSLHAARTAEEIMHLREPFYRRAADSSFFVDRGARQAVATAIAEQYGILV